MSDDSFNTIQLHNWLERIRAGDMSARDELIRSVCDRMEALARKMLRDFPRVRNWEQTVDVLQNALIRLMNSLPSVRPESMRQFYSLAATQIRRELIDLARHYYGPLGQGSNLAAPRADGDNSLPAFDPAESAEDSGELDKWCKFHEAVEQLPNEEREVVSLIFYHGWKQEEIAQFFEVSVRTVQRWWRSAQVHIHELISGGDLPI